jgi:predicted enzyme related to lactoylglutathione lyase
MSTHFGMAVLFVEDHARSVRFYRDALNMKVISLYEGGDHPPWALMELAGFRLALHGGEYSGAPHVTRKLFLNFFVKDALGVAEKIVEAGGTIKRMPQEEDFRPTQPVYAFIGRFADPEGNEHFLIEETREIVADAAG